MRGVLTRTAADTRGGFTRERGTFPVKAHRRRDCRHSMASATSTKEKAPHVDSWMRAVHKFFYCIPLAMRVGKERHLSFFSSLAFSSANMHTVVCIE